MSDTVVEVPQVAAPIPGPRGCAHPVFGWSTHRPSDFSRSHVLPTWALLVWRILAFGYITGTAMYGIAANYLTSPVGPHFIYFTNLTFLSQVVYFGVRVHELVCTAGQPAVGRRLGWRRGSPSTYSSSSSLSLIRVGAVAFRSLQGALFMSVYHMIQPPTPTEDTPAHTNVAMKALHVWWEVVSANTIIVTIGTHHGCG